MKNKKKKYKVAWDFRTTYWFEVEAINKEDAENKIYADGEKYLVEKTEESKEMSINEIND